MKRQFLKHLAVLAAACLAAPLVSAQASFPDRPIRFIVPFPPGGSTDPIARVLGQKMGEILGQSIIVENRPGGNMAIGAGFVAKAPPDGYNLLFTAAATHVMHTMQTNLPYDSLKDFAPVAMVSRSNYMMAIHPSVPAKTLPEFIAYAKANPGKLNFASSGIGNLNHLAVELFNLRAGINMVHVPYKGGAQALQDLLAGRVQVMITNEPVLEPQVEAGALRALAYTVQGKSGPPRPTFTQHGLKDLEAVESLNILLAPVGTPDAVIAKLNAAVQQAMKAPELITAIDGQKQVPITSTAAQLGERLRSDRAKYAEIIEKANIKLTQ